MLILAIDTSCDDTCIALLEIRNSKFEIRSNVVSSQIKLHAKYGGIVPYLAKREHERNLPIVFKKALKKTGFKTSNLKSLISKIDCIAVTIGPGLEPCLWQGINFAKKLAEEWKKPIVPVNHLEGHILANWLLPIRTNPKSDIRNPKPIEFPAVCLIVSGGHTELFLMKDINKGDASKDSSSSRPTWKYKLLGETRDDAAGECLDKVARILGLDYPGGPEIEKIANLYKPNSRIFANKLAKFSKIKLPRPMISQKNYDFSFSGLKTAVLYLTKNLGPKKLKNPKIKARICYEVQQAVIDVLISKTIKAAKEYKAKSIMLGGGVAANSELRKQFKSSIINQRLSVNFLVPAKKFCTDNAAMIGIAGYFNFLKGKQKPPEKIKADANHLTF